MDAWIGALEDRLPPALRLVFVPSVRDGQFSARSPENYDSVLTNELGWRFKFIGWRADESAHRELRPAVEAATPLDPWAAEAMIRYAGQPVIIFAVAPVSGGVVSNKAPGMVTMIGEIAVYRGQVEGTTKESIWIGAPAANESGNLETVEVRAADMRGYVFGKYPLEDANAAFERWRKSKAGFAAAVQASMRLPMLERQRSSANGSQSPGRATNGMSSAAGSRR
jgi:hypothetical protein